MMDFYEEHSGDKQWKKDLLGEVCESGGRQCNEDLLGVVQEVIRRQVAIGGSLMRSVDGHLAASTRVAAACATPAYPSGPVEAPLVGTRQRREGSILVLFQTRMNIWQKRFRRKNKILHGYFQKTTKNLCIEGSYQGGQYEIL